MRHYGRFTPERENWSITLEILDGELGKTSIIQQENKEPIHRTRRLIGQGRNFFCYRRGSGSGLAIVVAVCHCPLSQ